MTQQYGYGYGYQQYAYAQPSTSAVPQAASTYNMGYSPRLPYAPPAAPPGPTAASAGATQQGQQQQQTNVGYTPYGGGQTAATSSNQSHNTPPPPPPPGTGYGSSQAPSSVSSNETTPQSYYNYPTTYKPQQQQSSYYNNGGGGGGGGGAKSNQSNNFTGGIIAPSTPGTYTSKPLDNSSPSSAGSMVGYPSYSQNNYASAANAYYKHMKDSKASPIGGGGGVVGYQGQYATTGGDASSGQTSAASLTPVQQQVVQQYIHQKVQTHTGGIGGGGGGGGGPRFNKKPFAHPQNSQSHYCEVCKISAASALTYKTHLEGKNHKKKLAQQSVLSSQKRPANAFYCELCDVLCSNKDGLEAHMRGSKHTKVVNLHRRMGKPIPVKAPMAVDGTPGKTVMVTAPRISFVGGKKLSSTSSGEYKVDDIKVYPPPAAMPTVTTASVSTPKVVTPAPTTTTTATPAASIEEELDPEPVGEYLVILVKGDPKFPHATHKCEMCDCYFNDEYAKKAHVKGRRHRLNYKKMYQPTLYVEPTKSMRKEIEKKKKHRELFMEMKKGRGDGESRGGGWSGRGNYTGGSGNSENWSNDSGLDVNEARRKETLELARMRQREEGYVEFYHPGPMAPPPMMPYQHRNPCDDKLVLSKHSLIYPNEDELKAVDSVVADVEKVLKNISDDLLNEMCESATLTAEEASAAKKDESKRELKGVMRVGAFARGLLLKGECSVELVVMTASKPSATLFQALAGRIPAKFEELNGSEAIGNIYNITPDIAKAAFIIISQVEDYCVQVTVTMTSASMREDPTPELAKADREEGVLDRQSCLAALAALRHTKWFQAMAHHLPSCIITMRVIKDICRRVPAWGVLDTWNLQLLVQKCIVSANSDFTKPGDVFRRILECVASGLFLPGGPGLSDPCEKGAMDASVNLTAQERANITLSAQHALRLVAFDKLHLVLGVDPLPVPGVEEEGTVGEGEETVATGIKREAETSEALESKKIKLEN